MMPEIQITQLSDAIGVEIRGLDLTLPLSAEEIRLFVKAWYDHVIVLFRDQDLTLVDEHPVLAGAPPYRETVAAS